MRNNFDAFSRKNTVFGKLILGDDVLKKIECVDVDGLTPLVRVKIVDCGMNIDINDYGSMASKNGRLLYTTKHFKDFSIYIQITDILSCFELFNTFPVM